MKTASTELTEQRNVVSANLQASAIWTSIYSTERCYAYYQRRAVDTISATKPYIYNGDLPALSVGAIVAQIL